VFFFLGAGAFSLCCPGAAVFIFFVCVPCPLPAEHPFFLPLFSFLIVRSLFLPSNKFSLFPATWPLGSFPFSCPQPPLSGALFFSPVQGVLFLHLLLFFVCPLSASFFPSFTRDFFFPLCRVKNFLFFSRTSPFPFFVCFILPAFSLALFFFWAIV